MATKQVGFTLVEIMIAVAILGVLASIALPAYQDSVARSRIAEGLFAAAGLQTEVSERVDDLDDLEELADSWNIQAGGTGAVSKYVRSVQINRATGEITVTLNDDNIGGFIGASPTLVYTPYRLLNGVQTVLNGTFGAAASRMTAWGCASDTNVVSAAKGLPSITSGTLEAKYAPPQCR